MITNSTTTTTTNNTTNQYRTLDLHLIRDKMKTPQCAKPTTTIIINSTIVIMQSATTTIVIIHITTIKWQFFIIK